MPPVGLDGGALAVGERAQSLPRIGSARKGAKGRILPPQWFPKKRRCILGRPLSGCVGRPAWGLPGEGLFCLKIGPIVYNYSRWWE